MLYKLFIAVMTMSDTGSVATSTTITDYPSKSACIGAAAQMGKPKPGDPSVWTTTFEGKLGDHKFTASLNASCSGYNNLYDGAADPIPPPIANAIEGFLRGMQQEPR
jgi:hypothetical protein